MQPDGLKPVAFLGSSAERYLFDSTVLAEPLTGTLARLEERLGAAANEKEGRRLRQQIELVGYLITHWVVNGFTERAERTVLDRRVEVAAGWPGIALKLRLLDRALPAIAVDTADKAIKTEKADQPASATRPRADAGGSCQASSGDGAAMNRRDR